jgi:hypothetical protein
MNQKQFLFATPIHAPDANTCTFKWVYIDHSLRLHQWYFSSHFNFHLKCPNLVNTTSNMRHHQLLTYTCAMFTNGYFYRK